MQESKVIEIPYKPFHKQLAFHQTLTKFRAFVGGIGSGKTLAGCHEALRTAMNNPGTVGFIVAPTYKMLTDVTERTFFEILPRSLILEWSKGNHYLKLVNGSEIFFRSGDDPEKLRGPNLDWFWIDEAALVVYMVWKILIGRIRMGRVDRGWITTTPKGFDWIYDVFEKNKTEKHWYIRSSSRDNPFLPLDFIHSLEDEYAGAFKDQEIEGLFRAFEGLVYAEFKHDVHVRNDFIGKLKEYVVGVDWGYSNPAVLLVVGFDGDDRAYVVEEFYERWITIPEFVEVAKQLQRKYNATIFYADPSEPEHIQEFRSAGLRVLEANNEVMPGINSVASKIAVKGDGLPALFVFEGCRNLINEFQMYQFPDGIEGKPVKDAPVKVFDHAMDALRYVVHTRKGLGDLSGGLALGATR